MIIGERMRERIEARGLSQAGLARAIGVSPQAISKMVLGGTNDTSKLYQIARELETTPEYLTGESDDPSPGGPSRHFRGSPVEVAALGARGDLIEIDSIDLSFGLGGSFLDMPAEVEKATFSQSWLRQFTRSPPEMLFSTQGIGDSMMPTINDRDVLIIDRSQTAREGDLGEKVWAIVFGGMGMIKRLRRLPDGTVRIMSDNQLIRDELATDGDLWVVGRVVAVTKSL